MINVYPATIEAFIKILLEQENIRRDVKRVYIFLHRRNIRRTAKNVFLLKDKTIRFIRLSSKLIKREKRIRASIVEIFDDPLNGINDTRT